jgi:protein-disulfide isomerase
MEFANPTLASKYSFTTAELPLDSSSTATPWHLSAPQGGGAPQRDGLAANQNSIDPVQEGHDFIRGDASAPVTLVVYGNYLCRRFAAAQRAIDALADHYGPRLLRVVFRHLPLRDIYPNAVLAAEAAEVAAARGKFWDMHNRLLAAQDLIEPGFLTWHAAVLGLDTNIFQRELNLRIHEKRAARHEAGALRAGIANSPTIFVNNQPCRSDWQKGSLSQAVANALEGYTACFFSDPC